MIDITIDCPKHPGVQSDLCLECQKDKYAIAREAAIDIIETHYGKEPQK